MKLVLTTKSPGSPKDGKELVVDADEIKFFEPDLDPAGNETGATHIVFGSDIGRTVQESPADIAAAIGVVAVKKSSSSLAADVAKAPKKSR